jgi:hypothetical protein
MTTITRQSAYFDNTRIADYKTCPRKYFLRHVLHWTIDLGERKAPALVFGGAWHEGMDAIWGAQGQESLVKVSLAKSAFRKHWMENGYPDPEDMTLAEQEDLGARTPGTAHEMFFNYVQTRQKLLEECTVLGIEQPVAMPMPGLEDTWYIGRFDKVFRWNGTHIGEHKTTTAYAIKGQFQPMWTESWGSSSQVKGYQMIGSLYYPDLQDVWVDGALVHKKVHDAFKLVPVSHSVPLLSEWIIDTGKWISEIQKETEEFLAEGDLHKGTFRRNEDACFGKYGRCPFLDICSTHSDPSKLGEPPLGYKKEKWEPFNELGIDKLVSEEKS